MAPHSHKNLNFGGVNMRFPAKLAKSKNMHIIKTTASIPTKFCTVQRPPNVLCGWSEHVLDRSPRWRTVAILENKKSPYLGNGLTDRHEIWHGDAVWPASSFRQLKIWNFKNRRWPQWVPYIYNTIAENVALVPETGNFCTVCIDDLWLNSAY